LFKTGDNKLNEELNEIRSRPDFLSSKRVGITNYFNEYLTYGGYPAVVLTEKSERKIILLKELLNSYVKRDISEANIQNPEKFYHLLLILAEQTGNLLNVNEISQTLGLSTTSVNNYLYILRKCFHISLLKPFYRNIRKELTKMPKVYFSDLGLRNALLNQFVQIDKRQDRGILIENFIYLRLHETYDADSIRYWRTTNGNELDFVVLEGVETGFAIESKFQSTNFNPKQYDIFRENYPKIPLQVRSYNSDKNETWVLGF
jgi:predicted AAA+ superfamily ATPase